MLVICFEGPHGSGKSQLYSCCKAAGYHVLDEAFIGMPSFSLHPQTLVMESIWVSEWVKRLLQQQKDLGEDAKRTIFFCDRSPYSAVFYARGGGELLCPLIRAQLDELKEQAGIHTISVYLRTEKELLWERIQKRLEQEPFREKYNEGSREWMEKTVSFYEGRSWDFTVENDHRTIPELLISLLMLLQNSIPDFSRYQLDYTPAEASCLAALSTRKRTTAERVTLGLESDTSIAASSSPSLSLSSSSSSSSSSSDSIVTDDPISSVAVKYNLSLTSPLKKQVTVALKQ